MNAEEAQERLAPTGYVWLCGACGKTAEDRYGIDWDEACMMHAELISCEELSRLKKKQEKFQK